MMHRMVEASVEGAFTSGTALARLAATPAADARAGKLASLWRVTVCCRCSLNMLTQPNIRDTFLNR